MNNVRPASGALVALATAPGMGAIATLAVRGPAAWELVRRLLHRPGAAPFAAEEVVGRLFLAYAGPPGQTTGRDQVVVALRRVAPSTWVDIHCHGGSQVEGWLRELLVDLGAEECSWQQLERRTESDSLAAAAAIELTMALTTRTASILLDQLHGAFAREVGSATAALRVGDMAMATGILSGLARYGALGRHLTSAWRVVILGAPNVGKSSLVNALAGFQRTVVADVPGTTRDVTSTLIAVDGWPVEIQDTAGLRAGALDSEEQGIERTRIAASQADLRIWLLDASCTCVWPDPSLGPVRLVVNKSDLAPAWDRRSASEAMWISAHSGSGIDDLCTWISRCLVPSPPLPGAAVPFTSIARHRVEAALHSCETLDQESARRLLENWESEPD